MSQLKDIYTEKFLRHFGEQVQNYQAHFDTEHFVKSVIQGDWPDLSLRQRMQKIATQLGQQLTGSYAEQLPIILKLHQTNTGFNFLFLPDFVSIYGLNDNDFDLSLDYLKKLTPYSSAEFAIRPFFQADHVRVLDFLLTCSLDKDEHIRRLASEGSRPRLPWGIQLKAVIADPSLTLPILTNLRDDQSLYVRKSVANHLNDSSKNHPDFVIQTCLNWQHHSQETDWIIRKACRTLVKNAYGPALALFGYDTPGTTFEIKDSHIEVQQSTIKLGDTLTFNYLIETTATKDSLIRLEYGVNYMKANGKLALKKFHISDGPTTKTQLSGHKSLSFKDLSTRKYYPGFHELILFCNGQEVAKTRFEVD